MNRLNLGSGGLPLEGYTNVDISSHSPKVDIVYDLNKFPWPFDDNWADEIAMSQCLEHLDDRNGAMQEIYRILRPGGMAKISVPHFTWQFAYADPTHKHFFAHMTFFYYAGRGGYFDFCFSDCKVKITFGKTLSIWNYVIEPLANLFPNIYEQSIFRMFPAVSVDAVLTK